MKIVKVLGVSIVAMVSGFLGALVVSVCQTAEGIRSK